MNSFFEDLITFFKVRYFNFKDLLRTIWRYYKRPKFALVDLALLLSYFFKSPYRIGREYKKQEPYGETPLATLDTILSHCPLRPGEVAYELGSGRGRVCFWLALYKGHKTVGIEYIPAFVDKAKKIASRFNVKNVEFIEGDILTQDLSQATWIYLVGSALSDDTICKLCKKLEKQPQLTRIITISYPLTAYSTSPKFVLTKTIDVEFSWGMTQAYIHLTSAIYLSIDKLFR